MIMETPTLTKKQQKSSLSAKKNKPKETIKNVLATSFDNFFWPKVSSEDYETLNQSLKENLPRMKENRVNIPWQEVKNVPKADRKQFRADYINNKTGHEIKNKESGELFFGVNDVTKLLEANKAGIVLISGDVQPILMVQHLIDLAVLYRIPVLIVDNLRNLLKQYAGISSIVLGIHINICSESNLTEIKKTVYKIFEKFAFPENHVNFQRSLKMNPKTQLNFDYSEQVAPEINIDEDKIRKEVYLKRENKQKRVFIPLLKDEKEQTPKMQVDETGFLAFSNESKVTEVMKPRYKSLIVKRLKGDPNRSKRKIECLKND